MKLHQKLILYFIAPLIIAGLATETLASCVRITQGPPCQEYWRADAVFIGVATSVVLVPNQSELPLQPFLQVTTYFSVEEAFKGVEGTVVVFDSYDCPYSFKEGERYLVYAHYNTYEKKLNVRVGTTRTRPISEAAEDLAYIRSLPSAQQTGSRIFGQVLQQGVKENKVEVEPLSDVKVFLEWNDERREVVTNGEGGFEFTGLAAGSYRIRVELPTYLDFREQTVKVTGRGCVTGNLYVIYKGQITGRVLDSSGKPVQDIPITLVPADIKPERILSPAKGMSPGITHFSNRDGAYTFSQLRPGRYLLMIDKEFAREGAEIARGLPRLFYPGVNDIKAATVIVVDKDQKPQEYDFILAIQP